MPAARALVVVHVAHGLQVLMAMMRADLGKFAQASRWRWRTLGFRHWLRGRPARGMLVSRAWSSRAKTVGDMCPFVNRTACEAATAKARWRK